MQGKKKQRRWLVECDVVSSICDSGGDKLASVLEDLESTVYRRSLGPVVKRKPQLTAIPEASQQT